MDTVIINGHVYVQKDCFVTGLLIRDGRIVRSGSSQAVLAAARDGYKTIDAKGRAVLPGFNDAHLHLLNYSRYYVKARLNECGNIAEIISYCRQFISRHPDLVSQGLSGRGWNETGYPESRLPSRFDLDQISTQIPVVLYRVDGHMCVTNTKALQMLDLQDDPKYDQGIFTEFDCDRPANLIDDLSMATLQNVWQQALNQAASVGLTAVASNDINDFEDEQPYLEMMADVYRQKKGPIRYRQQCCFASTASFEQTLANHRYRLPYQDELMTLGPLKLYKDGSLGARTALLYHPYADDPANSGEMVTDRPTMDEYMRIAAQYGIQVITHAIGDKAIEQTCDSYLTVSGTDNPLRHGINHCQITTFSLLKKLADSHILIWYQPVFLEYDLHIVQDRVGAELARQSYAYKTAEKLGARISFSSDCPVESFNPFDNLHCAVNRQDYHNQPAGGFEPAEKMTVSEAIDAYTAGSAYMEFAEQRRGRLKEGYDADLIITDKDPFVIDPENLRQIKPVLTMVGGQTVFEIKD